MQRYEDSEDLRLQNFLQMVVIMNILINRVAYIVHKCKELEQKKICFQVNNKMSLNSMF